MYVCICQGVSDHRIREAVAKGATSFEAVQERLDVSTCCGCCEPEVREIITECLHHPERRPAPLATLPGEPLSALR